MKKNDGGHKKPLSVAAWLLIGGLVLATGVSHAVTAVGTASATVVDSVAVIITVPPPAATAPSLVQTPPVLSGIIFTVESFTSSLSTSGPLLRAAGPPPSESAGSGGEIAGAQNALGGVGAGGAPPAVSTATVSVTRRPDGSLAVSGGSALTFAVSQPVNGAVNIEYN